MFQAKEKVGQYCRPVNQAPPAASLALPHPSEPPPPYSPPDQEFLQKMASTRHHSPSLQQLQEQLNEEDLWLNTTTFPQGPNSPEGLAWRFNDFNHPHTPTSDDKRESPTIPTNLLEFLTSTPPGKLSSVNGNPHHTTNSNNGNGGCGGHNAQPLNNRQQSMLRLKQQSEQQRHQPSPLQPRPRQQFYDHIEHNQSLPEDYDSDFDFLSSLPPTTLAAAINQGQLPVSSVEGAVNGRPQLCYILATAPNNCATSRLTPTSSILAVATPTSRHSPIQDSQVFPPPCYDSLPRSSAASAAAAAAPSPPGVASASQTDGPLDASSPLFDDDQAPSLPAEPPAISQSAQTEGDYGAMMHHSSSSEHLPGAAGTAAPSVAPLDDKDQQQPGTPDSLPLCCYPPVYVDDLEDHVVWDTDYEDGLTSAMGAAKID